MLAKAPLGAHPVRFGFKPIGAKAVIWSEPVTIQVVDGRSLGLARTEPAGPRLASRVSEPTSFESPDERTAQRRRRHRGSGGEAWKFSCRNRARRPGHRAARVPGRSARRHRSVTHDCQSANNEKQSDCIIAAKTADAAAACVKD